LREIERSNPDIIHVHNLFPNYGEAWVRRAPAPVVLSLHNYRLLCANSLLLRDGAPCTLCPDGDRFAGVRYRCYRNSRAATLPLAWANRKGLHGHPLVMAARRVIVLSRFAQQLYRRAGIPPERMLVWPNFLERAVDRIPSPASRSGWIFVGRVSPEKGILRLARQWPDGHALRVIGDGADMKELRAAAAGRQIELLGRLPKQAVLEAMGSAVGLVFPSVCFESFPNVYVEAMAAGLPVIAWKPNVASTMVSEQGTGVATTWDEDLQDVLTDAEARFDQVRVRCRQVYEAELTELSFVQRAEALYGDLM
jgi:glycosyltransferase involved in cell wall biosynthesis